MPTLPSDKQVARPEASIDSMEWSEDFQLSFSISDGDGGELNTPVAVNWTLSPTLITAT